MNSSRSSLIRILPDQGSILMTSFNLSNKGVSLFQAPLEAQTAENLPVMQETQVRSLG